MLLPFCLSCQAEEIDPELKAKLMQAVAEADSFVDEFDAQVWLMQKSAVLERFVKDPDDRLFLLRHIHREAKRADLPPEFVLAVIQVESHFDQFALSRVGARGLMQIMPFWKNEIGRETDNLMHIETNLRYGCTILKHYLERANGNWAEALARYNGSYGKIWYAEKVMVAWQKNWR
ncbi:lytic transglycosylase domain-containing protein [Saccharophagus degradans]|uniref:lytic transglycosylase domain-containing protein n=1 Tax=Saccharophagus degradans TaxID=86304 RepID=UPI001C0982E7|nr:lytic transglycosylase domain-containing protein [Saccharophagus degradans]MBU2984463.1 lytic transglycosylase domain-containing protein [Saccharophagus degradans]WGP00513.1 lytic transglycosylase domain-containing protein [Saccharophagus degradans]